ncbi:LuxR family transcriptional regulator [Mycobacterium sp. 852013-51886_SCH5428379]|nr:LuxR family transcriptional regulator [Mycobacterium sp. 852013-51886_SCH5428379]
MLEHLAASAVDCRVVRTAGVQAEMELAFAGLHQLCLPLMEHEGRLPEPQRVALSTALGMSTGPAPDRFLVGLAVLNLLSHAAEERPLLCLADDEQWLDRASAQVLAFVARRLGAESVGLVFAARVPTEAFTGLPALVIRGLRGIDARVLLETALAGPIDTRVRDQIVAETRGNPLALLELPRALSAEELAGGFGVPEAVRLPADVESTFRARIDTLPEDTRRLLTIAAAEPTGDVALMWRAATELGIDSEAAAPAVEAELATFASRVRFRHPLVRSAAYHSATLAQRREAHRALAMATDAQTDPDRRAWHRAHAASGPDDTVAADLESSAARAQVRGGVGAAAAFLERAATLTVSPAQRADRALAAASAKIEAGAFDTATDLLAMAEGGPLTRLQQAGADLARGRIAFLSSRGSDAPPLLLKAATQLEFIDPALSRTTYMDAFTATMFAGRLAAGGSALEIARAAATAPRPTGRPEMADLLLDWLVTHFIDGYAAALPRLRLALNAFDDLSPEEQRRWVWCAFVAATRSWDDDGWYRLSERHVELVRGAGALSHVPLALNSRACTLLVHGDLKGAAALIEELQSATDATGTRIAPYAALGLAAMRGEHDVVAALAATTTAEVTARGEGNGLTFTSWAKAVLHNGCGDYHSALAAARHATEDLSELSSASWALPELIEAAVRSGALSEATDTLHRLSHITSSSGTDWALGLEKRSRAIVAVGDGAERCYREAIEHLSRTRVRAELARAHLVYGEWLRRERRRGEARAELRTAHEMFTDMGMGAFAERSRRELAAVGDTPRKTDSPVADQQLTAQEAQVARLARDGLSNPEIGARLFISARTVQYHLGKVFTKLGITSRGQLDRVLP